MSSEQVTNKNSQQFIIDGEDLSLDIDHDIKKKKEKKENLIFVSLIASVILITGAIASF